MIDVLTGQDILVLGGTALEGIHGNCRSTMELLSPREEGSISAGTCCTF